MEQELNNGKVKRARRKQDEINTVIEKALINQIQKVGFSRLKLQPIAKEAAVIPAVIYNKYGNLNGLITSFTKKYDYWLNETLEKYFKEFERGDHQLFMTNLLHDIAKRLYKDKVMQQLLIWEVEERNEITKRAANMREANTTMFALFYEEYYKDSKIKFDGFISIMIAGIYYIILHKDTATFCGLDMDKTEDFNHLLNTIEGMCSIFAEESKSKKRVNDIALKLKEQGVAIDIISEATGLSKEDIEKIE